MGDNSHRVGENSRNLEFRRDFSCPVLPAVRVARPAPPRRRGGPFLFLQKYLLVCRILIGGGVTWDSCPEVIHIEQILGNYQNYAHEMA